MQSYPEDLRAFMAVEVRVIAKTLLGYFLPIMIKGMFPPVKIEEMGKNPNICILTIKV
jgi:hypothetical protein